MDVIEVGNRYYILATSALADERASVLKHGDCFAVFNRFGDIQSYGLGEQGLYYHGTRFLSALALDLDGLTPMLLSSTVRDDNVLFAIDLTNPDMFSGDQITLPRGVLHIYRTKFLWERTCYERLHIRNYHRAPVSTSLVLRYGNDFADIFEVRGQTRAQRGRSWPEAGGGRAALAYQGLDGAIRRTRIACSIPVERLDASGMVIPIRLEPRDEIEFLVTFHCEVEGADGGPGQDGAVCGYEEALAQAARGIRERRAHGCTAHSTNEQFNQWLKRSGADLEMMTTMASTGPYPYAGVPWFSTFFGRDGIITALECLWMQPGLARGVLRYLASTQATASNPARDAEPGKILHEARGGEMAALGEIPFGRYYGSVDATPLFLMLAGAYFERTGDEALVRAIWPNLQAALQWVDRCGDADGDGFIEYFRRSPHGLVQQGWKDSHDSVFHADGSLAEGPIALCEVQAYLFAGLGGVAGIAEALGEHDLAAGLRDRAEGLRGRFEEAFWCEETGTYALALDGSKRRCAVRTSNPGHCLFGGIVSPERAARVAESLLDPASFSGWGVRTVGANEARFNPMSYHNGSVWPHDNAIGAAGLARYGHQADAARIFTGLFQAAEMSELHRLPELFCGFPRRPGKAPTRYPVACSPQAWASAAVFLLLQASMGLTISASKRRICFSHPDLPEWLPRLTILNLRVDDAVVDLEVERHASNVGVQVLRRQGEVDIVVLT